MVAIVDGVRTHWPALVGATALALLVASPLYLVPRAMGEAYQGINIMEFGNDEHLYLSRGKEALEGKNLGQPFLAEGKDASDPTRSFPEKILVAPVRALGLESSIDIVTYFNVLNTAGVFVLVLAMYALGLRLSGNKWLALGCALFAIGGYTIIEAKTLFYEGFNIYGRSLYPYASSVPFFIFLNVLYDAVIRKRGWPYTVGAGLLLGLLCYIYFYAWTFAFALLGALGIIFIVLRDWNGLWAAISVGALGLSIGAYNISQMFAVILGQFGTQISYFYFSVKAHTPVMSKIGTATLVLLLFALWRGVRDRSLIFIAALVAAGWISLNQQIVTGRMLQYGHYYWYFIVPLAVIIGPALLARVFPERLMRYLAFALIAVAFLNLAGQQYRSVPKILETKIHEQSYAPILTVLNREPSGVVLASTWSGKALSTLVTIYTSHDLYWFPSAEVHIFPIERLREALMVHLFLNHESRADPIHYLKEKLAQHTTSLDEYVNMYGELEGFYSGFDYRAYQDAVRAGEESFGGLREKLLAEIAADYEARFHSPAYVEELLKVRGVRYVLSDATLNPGWDLSVFPDLSEIIRNDSVVLYEFFKQE
ncbi:hypothetical protein A3A39_03065 [Candidatus Kaiserbacteria bacterium RIFCSPLOWO2_01_FULL_54_13]|uniref:Glycosyltransferase RgtA/B/C/D-like domain-containing protein n=1 Tax=Candidatus Kaiserbacteria bacterium RIFCSPLOWO2_01_FULL_54_13 TaxID=1798512 RepID=A0A1F6F2E5_9BACT|nr:MAG: hypothetical protein A3A39_03065 [Candidatus Kaiserbacteria bacterium RIFCSPLOWO2_01_FULL_54_13]